MDESTIFKNEETLSSEYLPDILPHREQQIKELSKNLLPASEGRKPINTFIFGASGIGKTASVKFVFREFENFSGVKTVYVNCWDYKTSVALLSKITIDLGYPIQRRGWAKDEIVNRFVETINKKGKSLIICLDEVDQLDQDALYDLLRINQYVKSPVGLIFISNNSHVFATLEPRIKSSLAADDIEFKPYSLEEMKKILGERVKDAFTSVENGAIAIIANQAVNKGGDVRIGLQHLLKAGRLAEQENSDKLTVEHVKKVLKEVKAVKPEIMKEKINEHEKNILNMMEKDQIIQTGDLYIKYSESVSSPVSDRMFRDCLNHLAQLNLVKIRKRKLKGSIRLVSKV